MEDGWFSHALPPEKLEEFMEQYSKGFLKGVKNVWEVSEEFVDITAHCFATAWLDGDCKAEEFADKNGFEPVEFYAYMDWQKEFEEAYWLKKEEDDE